jgi:hypothetical protein
VRKHSYFDEFVGSGWPTPDELKPYFLGAPGRPSSFEADNDCWGLSAEGADQTEHLPEGKGRIDIRLTMVGNPDLGVLLQYLKYGGGSKDGYYSKGDMTRLREWTKTRGGDLMPVGLFIPAERAWAAVKEFLQKDGALPNNIEWIADEDVPGEAFPDPAAVHAARTGG